jgi:hypothetical protein
MLSKLMTIAFIGVLAFGVLSFAGSTPVSAQAESYTEVDMVDGCYFLFRAEYCERSHLVIHRTIQPDGDRQSAINAYRCVTITDPSSGSVVYEGCHKGHSVQIIREGEPQVYNFHNKGEYTYLGRTCTYGTRSVYANGELRVEEFDSVCIPTPA